MKLTPIYLSVAVILTGCQAMNSLVFHPIHKVWSDHQANSETVRARESENYVRDLEIQSASEEYMRTNSLAPKK